MTDIKRYIQMSKMTITEALAEIKTLEKRIEKKKGAIVPYIARQDGIRDPMVKEGGSEAYIKAERQAISDLESNIVKLRIGINNANNTTTVTIEGVTKTISEWIIWRREISKSQTTFLQTLRGSINQVRQNAQKRGENIVNKETEGQPQDWIINVNEGDLWKEIEQLETVLSSLDGQLSLRNATTMIEF